MNRSGDYATVLVRGAILEGSSIDNAAILVKRFPFGWQNLALLNERCNLPELGVAPSIRAALLRGMPAPRGSADCGSHQGDRGPTADVVAVRKIMRGPLTPTVRVVGDFAVGEWYGGGGGESVFERSGSTWKLILAGGGSHDISELARKGVPVGARCELLPDDRDCHARAGKDESS